MAQKIYEVWGWGNAERTVPVLYEFTDRALAHRCAQKLQRRNMYNMLLIGSREVPTTEQVAFAESVLFGGGEWSHE